MRINPKTLSHVLVIFALLSLTQMFKPNLAKACDTEEITCPDGSCAVYTGNGNDCGGHECSTGFSLCSDGMTCAQNACDCPGETCSCADKGFLLTCLNGSCTDDKCTCGENADDPECKKETAEYCPACNGQPADCEQQNPDKTCKSDSSLCTSNKYCSIDTDAQQNCEDNKKSCEICEPDDTLCGKDYYCNQGDAATIAANESACENRQINRHPPYICEGSSSVCGTGDSCYYKSIFTFDYDDGTGVKHFRAEWYVSYTYDHSTDTCHTPTTDDLLTYAEEVVDGTYLRTMADSPYITVAEIPECKTSEEYCPDANECRPTGTCSVDGVCSISVDECTAGIPTVPAVLNGNTWNWNCNGANGGTDAMCTKTNPPVDGVCGVADGSTINPGNSFPTSDECNKGTASPVPPTLADKSYSWSCAGSSGGTTASCNASVGNCPSNKPQYCPAYNKCIAANAGCEDSGTAGSNPDNFDGTDGPVSLCNAHTTSCLKVFPPIISSTNIIPSTNFCQVTWGKGTGVFDSYKSPANPATATHCTLSNQDGIVVSDFEPGDIGAPTGYPLGNPPQIKKDTAYTLKCWDGTDDTNPAIATGVCRVSTKQGEFN